MGLTGVAGTVGVPATYRLVGRRPVSPLAAGVWGDRPCAAPFSSPALGIEAPGALGGADAAAVVFGPAPAGDFSGGRNSRTGGRSGVPLPAILSEGREMAGTRGLTPTGCNFGELAGVTVDEALGEELIVAAERGAGERSRFFCRKSRTASAVFRSTELEWVFFSSIPSSGRTSRIAPALTSSSRANSLIRIFCALSPKTGLTP